MEPEPVHSKPWPAAISVHGSGMEGAQVIHAVSTRSTLKTIWHTYKLGNTNIKSENVVSWRTEDDLKKEAISNLISI